MKEEQKAYRGIVKTTALFGGVQGFQVLLSAIRVKVVAVLLGVEGMGVMHLLNSTLYMLQNFTGLGIDRGAVRELSQNEDKPEKTQQTITTIRHWNLLAALLGATLMLSLASQLSRWSFGSTNFTGAYMWLAFAILFDTLSKGELGIFQGLRKVRLLAKANLLGSLMGLLISLPIYYIWGIQGIVAGIIAYPASVLVVVLLLGNKEQLKQSHHPFAQSVKAGKGLITLGIMFTISGFIGTLSTYLFNIYLNHYGGIEDVGLYQSGFNLIDKYVGLIFVAMLTDYYPRLSAAHTNAIEVKRILTQQTNVALLVLCPIVVLFIATAPVIVRIFLTSSFLPVIPFLSWAILGMICKVPATSLAYVLIAKGDTKTFIFTEILSWSTILCCNIAGYILWGIEGIGIAFLVSYAIYFAVMLWVCARKHAVTISRQTVWLWCTNAVMGLVTFLCYRIIVPVQPVVGYIVCGLIGAFAIAFSARGVYRYMK